MTIDVALLAILTLANIGSWLSQARMNQLIERYLKERK